MSREELAGTVLVLALLAAMFVSLRPGLEWIAYPVPVIALVALYRLVRWAGLL